MKSIPESHQDLLKDEKSKSPAFFMWWVLANTSGFAAFGMFLFPAPLPAAGGSGFGIAALISLLQAIVLGKRLEIDGITPHPCSFTFLAQQTTIHIS
jgi:hypothetical protein